MKTVELKIYKFQELDTSAQQKALESLGDINVNYDWWESVYEDAKTIGLELTSFDLDRNRHACGKISESMEDVCLKICLEHGATTETYKTASHYLEKYAPYKNEGEKYLCDCEESTEENNNGEHTEDCTFKQEGEKAELEVETLHALLEDYSVMLQEEYEYMTSDEAIRETIEANDYDFTEDGKIY